jgi:putative alpha-1,2-mannosidase
MKKHIVAVVLFLAAAFSLKAEKPLTTYVNPFLGTAPLIDPADIGFTPPWRVWAGLVFPGASLPNAMVQLTPITKFRSGAGYEYENNAIHAFAHTCKGHWNLCNLPILPATGDINPDDFSSTFNHKNESAHPGYYQVFLERYNINAELTSTLRCGYHKYTYKAGENKKLILNIAISNERVRDWNAEQDGDHALKGFQAAGETFYFYAITSQKIKSLEWLNKTNGEIAVVNFADSDNPVLEVKLGISLVSI